MAQKVYRSVHEAQQTLPEAMQQAGAHALTALDAALKGDARRRHIVDAVTQTYASLCSFARAYEQEIIELRRRVVLLEGEASPQADAARSRLVEEPSSDG